MEVEKCVHVQSIVYRSCQSRDGPFESMALETVGDSGILRQRTNIFWKGPD